jgi:uncharacterized damage-inducible protein DinB
MDHLKQQAAYQHWALSQWIDFVYDSSQAQDPYLYSLVNHIVKGERAWLERIAMKDWNPDLWEIENKETLTRLAETNRQILQKILEQSLEERMEIKRLNGQVYNPKLVHILQHIFFHGENHRGQLASFSAKARLKYPSTDYMTYCITHKH